jgi:VCBS repeat protein
MNPRIRTALAFVIGLVTFAVVSLMPAGLAAAATQSGFVMQKTDGTPEIWQMNSAANPIALGFDFDLPTPTGSGWQIVGVGDFDGDGNPDILWQNTDGTPGIWFLRGTQVVSMVGLSNPGANWKIVGVGDFNGDGKADILWQATDGTPGMWLMSGSTVIAAAGLSGPTSWKIVGAGDFNADGKSDILWQNTDGTAGVWLMNGTTPIAEAGLSGPGSGWKAVGIGDFNGDGRSDIVWQYADGTAVIWLMNGTSNTGQVSLGNPGSSWKIIAAGDFNGDGQADILWQGTDGTPGIWLMSGTTPIQEAGLKNPGTSWRIITAGAFGVSAPIPVQANDGHVQITTVGGVQTVFNHTTDACNPSDPNNDQPDSGQSAFRNANGTVSLVGNNWAANYRMTGSSLDSVQRSCTPTYQSAQDPVFSDFKNHEWLVVPYTLDGTTVYALTHNEWYPPCGDASFIYGLTLLVSGDGGASYAHPQNYKIAVPQAWDNSIGCPATYGYSFSNIIMKGGYYYAFIAPFPPQVGGSGTSGHCIMRTTNLADVTSWQVWNGGSSWQQLTWPATQCYPVPNMQDGMPISVTYSTYLNAFVALTIGAATGGIDVAYATSQDLLNWSPAQTILAFGPGGTSGFGQVNGLTLIYGTFLDPNSNQNFEIITQQPYLYLVYFKPNGDRDIVRQQIRFN